MSPLRRRTFQEVRDNLLTSITGGVAAEEHPFPPPDAPKAPFRYSLLRPPVSDVVSVYGRRNKTSHLFRKDVDYHLLDDGQTLEWPEGAEVPDDGTVFHVNYRPTAAGSVVTDIYTGSVVRTVSESVALELARVYAQLDAVYQAGFIDTATGGSLDNLVGLLGMERVRGGRAAGEILFERSPGSKGTINIPAGTRVMTEDGSIEYETTASVTMAETQASLRLVARDLERNEPVDADTLTVLPIPIAGIGSVTNPAPTAITTEDETDAELRTRARSFLHGSERGTLGAIEEAVRRQGITADVVEVDALDPGLDFAVGGRSVEITPHVESMSVELQQRILTAVDRVRPAGVIVRLEDAVAPVAIDFELRITTASGLLEQDRRIAQRTIQEGLADYLAGLSAQEPGSANRVVGLVLAIPEVEDVRILSVTRPDLPPAEQDVLDLAAGTIAIGATAEEPGGFPKKLGELRITDPGLPTSVNVVVAHPQGEPSPSADDIEGALTAAFGTLNSENEAEHDPPLTVSFHELIHVTPLPGHPAGTLADFDPAPPPVPDVSPYVVEYVLTTETGFSRILTQPADEFTLTPFERLAVAGVEIRVEP